MIKSLYLAHELIKRPIQSGIEIEPVRTDYVTEHPLFQEGPDEIYQDVFIAGAGDPLPTDFNSFNRAKHRSHFLSTSFQRFAAVRKSDGKILEWYAQYQPL